MQKMPAAQKVPGGLQGGVSMFDQHSHDREASLNVTDGGAAQVEVALAQNPIHRVQQLQKRSAEALEMNS